VRRRSLSLAALDVIRVEWDYKWSICAIAAACCLGFVVACAWAWRLRSGAILLLCSGYLLVGVVVGLHCSLALMWASSGRSRAPTITLPPSLHWYRLSPASSFIVK